MKKISASRKLKTSGGFTLLELILVIGLLAISFGVTSDILISLVRSQTKTMVLNSVEQQANFASLKLEKELRNATGVTMSGSDLVITKRNSINPVTYSLVTNTRVLNRTEMGPGTLPLNDVSNPGGVGVECGFQIPNPLPCFTVTGTSPTVVSIALRFGPVLSTAGNLIPVNTGTVDINSTIVVRSTY
jgi:type II secretory pathway pseudopilin PulG